MAVAYPSKNINNIIEASLVDNNINPGSQTMTEIWLTFIKMIV